MVAINQEPIDADQIRAAIDLATGEDCWEMFGALAEEMQHLYEPGSFFAGLLVGAYYMAVRGN